jgi:hypothetical protein
VLILGLGRRVGNAALQLSGFVPVLGQQKQAAEEESFGIDC